MQIAANMADVLLSPMHCNVVLIFEPSISRKRNREHHCIVKLLSLINVMEYLLIFILQFASCKTCSSYNAIYFPKVYRSCLSFLHLFRNGFNEQCIWAEMPLPKSFHNFPQGGLPFAIALLLSCFNEQYLLLYTYIDRRSKLLPVSRAPVFSH